MTAKKFTLITMQAIKNTSDPFNNITSLSLEYSFEHDGQSCPLISFSARSLMTQWHFNRKQNLQTKKKFN